jgi:hypothetical protein
MGRIDMFGKRSVGIAGVTIALFGISQAPAWAYDLKGGNTSCTKATVQTKGRTSPGSQQRHKHQSSVKTFSPVYGVWYTKYYNAGYYSAGWYVEALDYSGTASMDKSQTYGYCIS